MHCLLLDAYLTEPQYRDIELIRTNNLIDLIYITWRTHYLNIQPNACNQHVYQQAIRPCVASIEKGTRKEEREIKDESKK